MLINTKHIVMFDDAVSDFGRIANMVDNDGAVLILREGKPAYAVVPFDEVQEAERPASGSTPKVEPNTTTKPAGEPRCACGKHAQSECGCGGHGGGHGHNHGGQGEPGHKHGHGGHGGHGAHGHPHGEHFGHGANAGHIFSDDEGYGGDGTWFEGVRPGSPWEFSFEAGEGFDPLFHGGPNVSVEDIMSKMPAEVVEAGKRFVTQLSPLINLFGTGNASTTPTDSPKDQ